MEADPALPSWVERFGGMMSRGNPRAESSDELKQLEERFNAALRDTETRLQASLQTVADRLTLLENHNSVFKRGSQWIKSNPVNAILIVIGVLTLCISKPLSKSVSRSATVWREAWRRFSVSRNSALKRVSSC